MLKSIYILLLLILTACQVSKPKPTGASLQKYCVQSLEIKNPMLGDLDNHLVFDPVNKAIASGEKTLSIHIVDEKYLDFYENATRVSRIEVNALQSNCYKSLEGATTQYFACLSQTKKGLSMQVDQINDGGLTIISEYLVKACD